MKYIPIIKAQLYLNEDEVDVAHPEYDYMLIAPDLEVNLVLGKKEARIWELLKEGLEASDVIARLTLETGEFEDQLVSRTIDMWLKIGLIYLEGDKPQEAKVSWWRKLVWIEFSIRNFDHILNILYKYIFRYLFTFVGFLCVLFVLIVGATLTYLNLYQGIWMSANYPIPNSLIILLSALGCLYLHEMGHALAMAWAGAKVERAGVALYLGLPVFFVDTSPVWAKKKYKRIITSSAGIIVNLTLAAAFIIIMQYAAADIIKGYLLELAFINVLSAAISTIPFIRMDGYYVMLDLVGSPNLNDTALKTFKDWFTKPIPQNINRRNISLGIYAIINIISSGLLIIYSGWYWWRLVSRLFN